MVFSHSRKSWNSISDHASMFSNLLFHNFPTIWRHIPALISSERFKRYLAIASLNILSTNKYHGKIPGRHVTCMTCVKLFKCQGVVSLRFGIYTSRSGTRKFRVSDFYPVNKSTVKAYKTSSRQIFSSCSTWINKLHTRPYRCLACPVNRKFWHRHFYPEDVGYEFLRKVSTV